MHIVDTLKERGFIEDMTHDEELYDFFSEENRTCYIGFDPTASSLHVGSLVPIMSLVQMQRHGHRPIPLIGAGTGLVGDPSGKTEMRQFMTVETVNTNAEALKKQLSRFIDFSEGQALMLNNADWLVPLEYISFLRDIGRHFSVNRMMKAESYRMRLDSEEGLSFIEFNYMLLQAYDFLTLFDKVDCRLQMGGSDQWGNIVAGIELIRRMRQETAFGITFPLITTASGAKMGKTADGAVWLDSERTSPYDYFQYWVNTDDRDVIRFLSLFTFLPIHEIQRIEAFEGADLNSAKMVLAYETTRIAHGDAEAEKAFQAACQMFGAHRVPAASILPSSTIPRMQKAADETIVPTTFMDPSQLETGIPAFKLFSDTGLAGSSSAARRLIDQGGAYINGQRAEKIDQMVTLTDLNDGEILLRSGKKRYHRIKLKND